MRIKAGIAKLMLGVIACIFAIQEPIAQTDNRLLHFSTSAQDGTDTEQSLSLDEMRDLFTETERRLFDIQYDDHRGYKGFDLTAVLTFAGFEPGATLMLVCEDGYKIPFDSSVLDDPDLRGMIATADLAPSDGENWKLYQHGRELVSFDPFYIVWSLDTDSGPAPGQANLSRLKELPWPYQFQEIRNLRESDYAAAKPPAGAPDQVQQGFSHYMDHCYKCHRVAGVGGTLAPALDRPNSVASVLDAQELSHLIRTVTDYYPLTKMPNYTETLTETEALEIALYLKYATGTE